MNQKENIWGFTRTSGWCKSMCVVMVLFAHLFILPISAMALESDGNQMVNQQQIAVKGVVLDPEGEPVIGATVQVEGTSTGTITDIDGNFSLFANSDANLVISYVGYSGQKVRVSQQLMRIVLQEDSELLDEVVVVGYGAVKRANLTGAVSSVDMKELADIPATNLASTLMGTMSGVTVGEATGNPLGNTTIQIRIAGSWNEEPPLYVIDGFIRDADAFNMLDASEIESVSVLKDAQAAVYGVRGAGGVILVSTKKGKEAKTSINYSGTVGVSQGINMPKMMSAWQQATALNDMYSEQRKNGEDLEDYLFFSASDLERMETLDYNWLDGTWKDAINTRHTLNVSGGTDKIRYFVGGNYMYQNGNFRGLDVNRFGIRTGIDVNFTKELKGSFNISYTEKNSNQPLNQGDTEPDRMYGTFNDLNRMPRWVPSYIDGMPVSLAEGTSGTHPIEALNSGSKKKNRSGDIALGAKFDYDIKWVQGLSASLSMNFSRSNGMGRQIYRPYNVYTFAPNLIEYQGEMQNLGHFLTNEVTGVTRVENKNQYQESASNSYSYQINPQINYHKSIKGHDISAMYVFEVAESAGNSFSYTLLDEILPGVNTIQGYDANTATISQNITTKSRRLSHIGRLNYSYGGRYFLEGTIRYEASTNFAPEYRWGVFGSLSAAWRISEEAWFRDNVTFIDNLKLRGSYGRLGSDRANMRQWQQSYSASSGNLLFGADAKRILTISPTMGGLLYYNSSWEKSDSYNGGIDLRFTNGIFVNLDGFYRYTFDILDQARSEFPQSAGITGDTPKLNYGKQEAWGSELELGYQKQLNRDWSINIKGNLSYATNRVIKKYMNPGIIGTWQDETGTISNRVTGYKVWRGVDGKGDGMARTQQDIQDYIAYLLNNEKGNTEISVLGLKPEDFRVGMLMYEDRGTTLTDQVSDGVINSDGDECVISKYNNAPWNYGYTLGFSWKNLSVSALFTGSFGNKVVFDKNFYADGSGGRTGSFLSDKSNNLSEWFGNYAVTNEDGTELLNPDAKYPRLDKSSLRAERSDFWLRNGFNMRLRTINVSYNLPKEWMKKVHFQSCRVFFTANNIWTIVNPFPYKDAYVGYWSDYPQTRTFNFGINLNI